MCWILAWWLTEERLIERSPPCTLVWQMLRRCWLRAQGAQQRYCFGDMVQVAFAMLQHLNDPCFHPCYGDSTAG